MSSAPGCPQTPTAASATPSWNAAAICSRGRPRRGRRERRRRDRPANHACLDPARVRRRGNFAGEMLELDRSSTLVADLRRQSEQRGDRVEEAAHARGERRVHLEALAHPPPPRERDRAPGAFQVAGGHAPGLADRGLPARQRHGLQVGDPLGLGQVAPQQLAAPDGAVVAVAGSVEDERQRRPLPRRARRGRRPRGRGDAEPRPLGLLVQRPSCRGVVGVQVVGDDSRGGPRASLG